MHRHVLCNSTERSPLLCQACLHKNRLKRSRETGQSRFVTLGSRVRGLGDRLLEIKNCLQRRSLKGLKF
ncbi:hypothetical protein [Brasilonema sp. UFV-L1]|uniref:hypothetical protein n=1 Tax=Brasilonema sp. UFV-L1 TaxID=2234130 RepID=UPI0030D85975